MAKKIDSKMMKRAVSELFNHEIGRNSKVSSHSQLERWIVEELKMYSNPVSAKALQLVMQELRNIDFNTDEPEINSQAEAESRLREEYNRYGFSSQGTGGGCTALSRNQTGSPSELLVTSEGSGNAPDNLLDAVELGLYDGSGNLLISERYVSSFEMFGSDWFKWLVETQ